MDPAAMIDSESLAVEIKQSVNAELTNSAPPSIFHSKQFIELGDMVILFQTRDNLVAINVTPGQVHHSKWGKYNHDDMIGMRFGSRMASPAPQAGYIHLLRPTPPLWSLSLPHRTQIVYLPDISFIMNELAIKPGSRVIEAGTGSGSMSHALAMTVGGSKAGKKGKGKLFTYEYHATRFEKAREEFEQHGLSDIVHLQHRNVCKDGFGQGPSKVDAVFLDLPAPWEAIPHAVPYLRDDISTRICCFSPCIEQVTRTVQALDANNFTHIEMYEVLVRPHEIAQPAPVLLSVSTLSERLKKQEVRKEERRQVQIDIARKRNAKLKEDLERAQALGIDPADMVTDDNNDKRARSDDEEQEQANKKQKINDDRAADKRRDFPQEPESTEKTVSSDDTWGFTQSNWLTRTVPEVRGHTSYLTFATMFPRSVREVIEAREEEKKKRVLIRTAELTGVDKNMAKTVAMRALATASGSQSEPAAGPKILPGSTARTLVREDSVDTFIDIDDGLDQAIASFSEEQMQQLYPKGRVIQQKK